MTLEAFIHAVATDPVMGACFAGAIMVPFLIFALLR